MLTCVLIGLPALRYIVADAAVVPGPLRPSMAAKLPFFFAHTVAGAVALLLVP